MRILMTTDTVGGVWTFTSELTRQFLALDHAVHLVSFGRHPSADQQASLRSAPQARHPERSEGPPYSVRSANTVTDSATASRFSFTPTEIPLEWMQNNDRAYTEGAAVLDPIIAAEKPDLILSNQFCFGRLSTAIPRIVVAHSDVLSWARACRPSALEPSPWLNRYTSMVQAGLMDAAAVITPSAWMGKALINNFFLPRNYFVIPNGVTVERAPHPLPERKLQAVTAGRLWDEAKGLNTLQGLNPPFPILVAGDNTLDPATPQLTWPEHLTNLGCLSRPDLHQRFRESAIYLCTSRYEPFGLAPLEAALCGCALVLREIPSLREVWADSALYFNDDASLAAVLQTLATDPNLLAEAQKRAKRRAGQFTADRMAGSYLHLFGAVLQQSQAMQHVQ